MLVILIDDAGFGSSSAFGGPCQTPNFDRLAEKGLRYNRFHTTALCSPTRQALLTGRNHHAVGMGGITEIATSAPGLQLDQAEVSSSARGDAEAERLLDCAVRQVPRGAGLGDQPDGAVPRLADRRAASSTSTASSAARRTSTRPRSTRTPCPIEPDRTPEEGYHFTEDMTDHTIDWIRQQKALMPDKPFFIYYAPGATHAPHHVPTEWSDKYKGKFDQGWDKLREETFERQKELGVIPEDAELTARPAEIPGWDDMPDEMKPILARQMEVYAGFMEHTDHHVGRLIDSLEDLEILDDTLVYVIVGDNGASAEGTPNGCFNELIILNGAFGLETVDFMTSRINEFGTPTAYNHYAVGWAHAMDTPFQWTKQIASHWGGTRNGTIVHWPNGIKAKGEVRTQFHHVIDVAATVLDVAGLPEPTSSTASSRCRCTASRWRRRSTTRAPPRGGDAVLRDVLQPRHLPQGLDCGHTAQHPLGLASESPALDDDVWELYGPDDWTQAHDLAAEQPEKLARAPAAVPRSRPGSTTCCRSTTAGSERFNPDLAGRPQLIKGNRQLLFGGMGRLSENSVVAAQEQVPRGHGRDRGAGERRRGRDHRAGRRVRRLGALRPGGQAGVLLQPLRAPAVQGLRRIGDLRGRPSGPRRVLVRRRWARKGR